MYCN